MLPQRRLAPRLFPAMIAAAALLPLAAWLLPTQAADGAPSFDRTRAPRRVAAPPKDARRVADAEELKRHLSAAAPGTVLALEPGHYEGPFSIPAGVTVWGPPEAVIGTSGEGTTVRMEGADAALLGVTVDGSGGRYDTMDAAVRIGADGVRVEGVLVRNAVFGVVAEQCSGVTVAGNLVLGTGQDTLGLRGDGIRLWETYDSVVRDNAVADSRDLVVWYSSRNRIEGNHVHGCRYGTHFMYSHDNVVRGNRYVGNVVGVFVMYSRDVELRENVLADSAGAAGIGLGMKESSDLLVEDNLFVHDTQGIYVDFTPFEPGSTLQVRHNDFLLCETAVNFHASPEDSSFLANRFRDNTMSVRVGGGGDALGAEWRGNDFDEYRGYDLDGDGFGDVPHELRSATSQAVSAHPRLAFFRGTAAFRMLDAVTRVLPLYAPDLLLRDPRPDVGGGEAGRRP